MQGCKRLMKKVELYYGEPDFTVPVLYTGCWGSKRWGWHIYLYGSGLLQANDEYCSWRISGVFSSSDMKNLQHILCLYFWRDEALHMAAHGKCLYMRRIVWKSRIDIVCFIACRMDLKVWLFLTNWQALFTDAVPAERTEHRLIPLFLRMSDGWARCNYFWGPGKPEGEKLFEDLS